MDRFLKRPTPAVDTSSVNSNPSKKPKPSAKQGDVSAWFMNGNVLHHTAWIIQRYKSILNIIITKLKSIGPKKLALNAAQSPQFYGNFAAISSHNLTIFAALCRTIRLFEQVRHRIICDFWPHLNVASVDHWFLLQIVQSALCIQRKRIFRLWYPLNQRF